MSISLSPFSHTGYDTTSPPKNRFCCIVQPVFLGGGFRFFCVVRAYCSANSLTCTRKPFSFSDHILPHVRLNLLLSTYKTLSSSVWLNLKMVENLLWRTVSGAGWQYVFALCIWGMANNRCFDIWKKKKLLDEFQSCAFRFQTLK